MNDKLLSSMKRAIGGKLFFFLVQFITLMIFARIFTPEEFGIIASIQVFIIFFQLLAEVGITPAIVNEKKILNSHRDGIYTFSFLLGVLLALSFYTFSKYLTDWYDYDYDRISIVISLSIFFSSICVVPISSLIKDSKFIDIAKIDVTAELIAFIFVLIFFYRGEGVFSLAIKPLAQSFFRYFGYLKLSKATNLGRPNFGKEVQHIYGIARFALYQFLFNIINFFSRNLDTILIAKYFGSQSIGIYDKSYQLMRYPLMLTTFSINPAIQSVLTNYQGNSKYLISQHQVLTDKLMFFGILAGFFINLNGESITYTIFGKQWGEVIPLISIFSWSIPAQAVLATSGAFFQVQNKPNILALAGFVSAFFTVGAVILGVLYSNLSGIALLITLSFYINYIIVYKLMFVTCFRSKSKIFFMAQFKSILKSIPPILIYSLLRETVSYNEPYPIVELIIEVTLAITALFLNILLLRKFNNAKKKSF